MQARRVAFLSEHASPATLLGGEDAGGQNVYVDELTRQLAELGYAIDIFTRPADPSAPNTMEWAPGVRIVNLHIGPPCFLPKDDLWPLMPEFRDAILDFIDESGTEYDLIHSNFWMSGWVATQLRAQLGIPAVHIFHALGRTKRRHQGDADTSPDGRIRIEEEVVGGVDRIIAQCPSEVDELVEAYGADPDRVVVIPPGVDLERYWPMPRREARRKLGLPADVPIVTYVGRMVPRKGVRNIVRALAVLAQSSNGSVPAEDVHLLVVGGEAPTPDPDLTPEIGVLQELGKELGVLERIHFTGARPPAELYRYYSAGDVVVTTPWYEPFGLTPLEAMACGRPVIGAAVGGINYTVKDGVTGLLVPPKEPVELATAISSLLDDQARRLEMGQAARARVEKAFSWARCARRTARTYRAVLAETATKRHSLIALHPYVAHRHESLGTAGSVGGAHGAD